MARYRFKLQFLILFFALSIFNLPVSAQSNSCPDVPPPRLTVGAQGRVTPGNANNVRDEASRAGKLLGQIPAGGIMDVLAGPTCADGLNWWQVRYADLEGWTVEAIGADYGLEPYDPAQPQDLVPTNEINYEYEGIRFELNPELATRMTASHLQPVFINPDADVAQAFASAGIGFSFTDSNGKTLPVSLRVYSVADFIKHEPKTEKTFATLAKQIEEDPGWVPPKDEIPVLSIVRQPTLFRAHLNELSFANGSGFRFLTQSSFDVRPIINPIDYRYSGLTYDGAYYVVVAATVTTPLLPDSVDPADSGADFENQFESYRTDIAGQLTKAKGPEFTPNLQLLDDLITSLEIGDSDFKVTTENGLTHVDYNSLSFDVDSSLAKDVDYQISLASWKTMSPLPEHICFGLQMNPLSQGAGGSQLCLIPTEGMDWYVKDLKKLLVDKPTFDDPDGHTRIPIPFGGASQLIHARVHYIDTDVLQGLSFVTRYAQMDYYIGGSSLEYNFSGITRGGKYIIYIERSTSTTLLSDKVPTTAQLNNLLSNPFPYYKGVVDILNAAAPSDFTPNLDMLDAIAQSIRFS